MLKTTKRISNSYKIAGSDYLFGMLNEMGEIIFSFDVTNKKVFVNQTAQNIFNLGPLDFGLNSREWLKHVHPADVDKIKSGNKLIINGTEIKDEFRIQMPDKNYSWVCRHVLPVLNENKKLSKVHVIISNIDSYKSNIKGMESKIDELSQVIYRIAHDLRGPMMSMLGLVNLSKYEVTDSTSVKYMDLIGESAKKMDNILVSLSSVVSIMSEHEKYKFLDFKEITRDILKSVEHVHQMEGIDIIVECKQKKPFLSDPGLIHSILYNLIINSIKYRRKTSGAFVKIKIGFTKGVANIEVEDNGTGIRQESLEHIFEMFFKDNEQPGSSGLGLYIVKNSIDKLKGDIKVISEFGNGTKFALSIPEVKAIK